MTTKMCNTINQNIGPFDNKLFEHIKRFGTLLNSNNNNSTSIERNDAADMHEISASSTRHNSNSDAMQSNAVWDRGKEKQDAEHVKQLESSLETYLETLPARNGNPMISPHNSNVLNAYLLNFDNLSSNDDLELAESDGQSNSFGNSHDTTNNKNKDSSYGIRLGNNCNNYSSEPNDRFKGVDGETASLSNFHNIRYIEFIHLKLEEYLKSCKPSSSQLESKIAELKMDVEKYVEMINQKKETELRRFSENMSNHSNIVHMRNAFMKKEMNTLGSNINQDNVSFGATDAVSYYSNDSITSDYERCRNFDGFFMKNCYEQCSSFNSTFDTNSIEYYSMLITEDRNNDNDAPIPPPRYNERERISLIYRNPDDHVIEQWQKYQLNTIEIKPKKNKKFVKIKMTKDKKRAAYDIWSFTLDYHKTKMLQMKLEKERKIRLICRMFFYFFGIVCFILVVIIVQSVFNVNKK